MIVTEREREMWLKQAQIRGDVLDGEWGFDMKLRHKESKVNTELNLRVFASFEQLVELRDGINQLIDSQLRKAIPLAREGRIRRNAAENPEIEHSILQMAGLEPTS